MKNMKTFAITAITLSVAFFWSASSVNAYYPTELISNGGFESDPLANGWSQYRTNWGNWSTGYSVSDLISAWTGTVWHGGYRGAKLGNAYRSEFLVQTVKIPSGVTKVGISFWYHINQGVNDSYYSYISYVLRNPSDNNEYYCNHWIDVADSAANGNWTKVTCDLSSGDLVTAVGKNLDILVEVTNYDYLYYSIVDIDDVGIIYEKPDATAPTTTANAGSTDGSNGYYKTIPTITLAASDDTSGSGVANIQYAWDGGATQTYTSPLSASQGTHTLTYYATDIAGNREATQSLTLKVDTVLPSTTSSLSVAVPDGANGYYRAAPTLTLLGSDGADGGGIGTIWYRLDGSSAIAYVSPLQLSDGTHTIYFRADDKAGNASSESALTVKIDTGDPSLALTNADYQETSNTAKVTISGTASDVVSGIASVTVNGIPVTLGPAGNFSSPLDLQSGINTVTVIATDNAGRSSTVTKQITYTRGKVLGESVSVPMVTKVKSSVAALTTKKKYLQKFVLTGQNFQNGAKVKLGKYNAKKIQVQSAKTIVIYVEMYRYKKGKYTLIVQNPDGQSSTKKKAVTVK